MGLLCKWVTGRSNDPESYPLPGGSGFVVSVGSKRTSNSVVRCSPCVTRCGYAFEGSATRLTPSWLPLGRSQAWMVFDADTPVLDSFDFGNAVWLAERGCLFDGTLQDLKTFAEINSERCAKLTTSPVTGTALLRARVFLRFSRADL